MLFKGENCELLLVLVTLTFKARSVNSRCVESYPVPTLYMSLRFFGTKLRPAACAQLCVLNIAIFWPLWTLTPYAFENGTYFTIAMDIIITCKWIKLQFDTNFVKIKYILTELLRTFDFSLLTPGDLDLESRSAKSSAGLSLNVAYHVLKFGLDHVSILVCRAHTIFAENKHTNKWP